MILLLELVESIRERLHDLGGDRRDPSAGFYATWQEDDAGCLWSNTELVRLLKRAMTDVALRAPISEEGVSDDAVGTLCRPSVTANTAEVSIVPQIFTDSQVLYVDQARLESDPYQTLLVKTTSAALAAKYGGSAWSTLTGQPTHYLEPKMGILRLFPIPIQDDVLRLRVRRGYSTEFNWSDIAREKTPRVVLEDVDDGLYEALILATCRLAFLKRDADTENLDLSRECERQLAQLVGPPISIRQREARRENANLGIAIRGSSRYQGSRYPWGVNDFDD